MSIFDKLYELRDEKNAAFQAKLTPTLPPEIFLGVRMPALRALAKELKKDPEVGGFLDSLPHKYYDENLLHSVLISQMTDYEECVRRIEEFLPYIDNWAVCDVLNPKIFKKHRDEILPKLLEWTASDETYTCRYGVDMLMGFFLDEAFKPEYLEHVAAARSEEYYVKMVVAWYFATALAKQWDSTIPYIEEHRLADWTHRKTIQKARESFRITEEQKEYLKGLK